MDTVSHSEILERRTQSSNLSTTIMRSNDGKEKILFVSEDLCNVITLQSVLVNDKFKTSVVPLNFPKIPSNAVINCIHCVNLSTTELDDFNIGLVYVTGEEGDKNCEKYLNIYSGYPGASLNIILNNCKTLKLDFVPFLLIHAVYMSETLKKGIWLLSGNDKKIHAYKTDGQQICEQNIEEYFVEFKETYRSVCLAFDTKAFSDYKKRVSIHGGSTTKSILSLVNSEKNQILSTFEERYHSPITNAQLFNVYNRTIKTDEFVSDSNMDWIPDNHSIDEKQQVCLLIGTIECTIVLMNVLEPKLRKPITLVEISRSRSVVTSLITDINFDSKNEIILGTQENHILSYEFKDDTWVELQSLDIGHPVYTISYVDLTGEGVKDAVVMTSKGIHILKHEPKDIIRVLMSHNRLYNYVKGPTSKGFYQSYVTPQSTNDWKHKNKN